MYFANVSFTVLLFGVYGTHKSGSLVLQLRACAPCHVREMRHEGGSCVPLSEVFVVLVFEALVSLQLLKTRLCLLEFVMLMYLVWYWVGRSGIWLV